MSSPAGYALTLGGTPICAKSPRPRERSELAVRLARSSPAGYAFTDGGAPSPFFGAVEEARCADKIWP
jgi:hypothetical protein